MSDEEEQNDRENPEDDWAEFRDRDGDPIGIDELTRLNLADLPEG